MELKARSSATVGAVALLVAGLAYIGLVDPHRPGSPFPLCPFRLLTGWNCPACGGLRMVHDLLHADLAAAVSDNAFLLVGLPVAGLWMWLRRRRGATLLPLPAVATLIVVALAWTVVRNVPGFPLVPTLLPG